MSSRFFNIISVVIIIAMAVSGCGNVVSNETSDNSSTQQVEYKRIISLAGGITEILYTLDQGNKVIGVDITSTYPVAALQLPKLGHVTRLNLEGILALKPDLVLAYDDLKDENLISQLEKAGIKVIQYVKPISFEASKQLIQDIGILTNSGDKTGEIIDQYETDEAELDAYLATVETSAKGIFIYARGAGALMVSGGNTPMNSMLKLSGTENLFENAYESYKPLTAESLVEANPEFIVMFSHGIASLEGVNGLLEVPGVAMTTAGKNQHIIHMDGHYLSGFGPRAAKAALELAQHIYGNNEPT